MSSTMAEPAPAAHTPSRKPYFLTCAFLLVMTLITYVVAKFDLGPLNDVVALSIAVFKATAVILFFMHVRHRSNRSEEHTSELQSHLNLVCRLLLEKKKLDR